jgi:ABC-type glutathione transport system ATPase component
MMISTDTLVTARLTVDYAGRPGVLQDASFQIARSEILALVGQSGSGKSTIGLTLLGLLGLRGGAARGNVRFGGRELLGMPERGWRQLRGSQIAFIPQSPLASLNPALRIGTQMEEAWRIHAADRGAGADRIREAMEMASLPATREFLRQYPSQLSVGLAQRVLIAMAILHRPSLLIADEPTSALDPITQSEILTLFADLNRRLGMAMLYISHDLLSVASLCHRVAILERGAIVETGTVREIFESPRHAYTQRLIQALPICPSGMQLATSR